ncbi:hypothetical protein HK102_009538 [Quaeritorhiza haematococci]|nr:hypothetical protein HK102_009538 [Quaeritorhiza haematococci]
MSEPAPPSTASNGSSKTTINVGSRTSQLAMIQTNHVVSLLQKHHPHLTFPITGVSTTGDKVLDVALSKIGTKSLFTKELEVELAKGTVDFVVHSLKDLPTVLPEGMCIGAVLEREDPRDAVVLKEGSTVQGLEELPEGAVLGTSSVRRAAQLKKRFPKLKFQDVRGNLNTRLRKLDAPDSPYSALVLAYAGLHRMGWDSRVSQILNPETILHAVGQGALAIECRTNDAHTLSIIDALNHAPTRVRCTAERGFMRGMEGGCSVPLGVWTELTPKSPDAATTTANGEEKDGAAVEYTLRLRGSICSVDGSRELRDETETTVTLGGESGAKENYNKALKFAEELGRKLAEIMIDNGAREIYPVASSSVTAAEASNSQ